MEKQMGSQCWLLLVLFLPLSIFHSLSNPNQFYNRVYLLSVCLQNLSCFDKGSSTHNPTSNQFNQSKHYTMNKACRKTTNHPFSMKNNGRKLSFSEHFTYALNGWFLTEITLANNFEKFSFLTIFTKLQSSLKKNMNLDFFAMSGQGKYLLNYFGTMMDVSSETLCAICYHLYILKIVKTPMEERYF